MLIPLRRLIAVLFTLVSVSTACARAPDQVWFSPDDQSPDLIELFNKPELWLTSRKRIDVFQFSPDEIDGSPSPGGDSFSGLREADAFGKLISWGIDIAIEAPAVKEWDCSALGDIKDPRVRGNASAATLRYIENIAGTGAAVRFVATDEPLASGTGACGLTIEETARRTSAYAKSILVHPGVSAWAPKLAIGDIEPYPSKTVIQLEQWTLSLRQQGLKPAFFHLDVDVQDVRARGSRLDFDFDLRALKSFFEVRAIPFGIIFWSGYDPESSDLSYYRHTLEFSARIATAIGMPDQAIFQSWVRRSSSGCVAGGRCAKANNWQCSRTDPPYCGEKSVPVNLPDNDPSVFSHTRLIKDCLSVLRGISER